MKTSRFFTISCSIVALLFTSIHKETIAQVEGTDANLQIKKFLTLYHDQNRFNGVVLVAKNGKTIFTDGFGSANIEWDIPNSPDNKYLIASVTKTFTATLIMKFIDQGRITLESKLSDLLPWYRKDVGERVTIKQLLNHTSGIPNYMNLKIQTIGELNKEFGTSVIDKTEFAKKYCSSDLEFEPGTKWNYNNSAYFLLALIIEQITQMPYDKALKEFIFDPLNMSNSGDIQPDPEQIVSKLATGYVKTSDGFRHMYYWNLSTAFGAGSIYSTVEDLLKFDQALYSKTFLSDKAKEAMFTSGLNGFGCGWELRQSPLGSNSEIKNVQTHEGFLWGWFARIYRIPEDGYFIAMISNTGDSPLEKMYIGITDILYGRNPILPKPSICQEVEKKYKSAGIDDAIEYCKALLTKDKTSWETSENELNGLGYQLLNAGLKDEAVKIFLWNTELHPESWNIWDSYGEGLLKSGMKQAAIEAYKKSIELNPNNTAGKEILNKLINE